MSNQSVVKRKPKVLFFGMLGNFSYSVLAALMESDVEVCAVVLPAAAIPGRERTPIKRLEQPRTARLSLALMNSSLHVSVAHLAWSRHITVWEAHSLADAMTISALADYEADIICVACFSLRIPRSILDLPRLGCLNVHPSLLPANRGPVPLFWTFRMGHTTTGVTIHLIDEGMDTGDILAQETLAVPDGITYAELEAQCATRGGVLLAHVVWDMYQGNATHVSQEETKASYHTFPTQEDFFVPVEEWDARHVYNFIRGVGHWDEPVELRISGQSVFVRDAISYSHKAIENRDGESYQDGQGRDTLLMVQCKTGHVIVRHLF